VRQRRPVREKHAQNKDFRVLLLELYNIQSLRLLWHGPLSEDLREAIFRAAQTDSFVAKRRYEREVVNQMREEDEEGIGFLRQLLEEETLFAEKQEKILQEYRNNLIEDDMFSTFVAEHRDINIQLFRQRLRNYHRKKIEKTKILVDDILCPLLFPLDWK
jgi:ribosomal 50S subunit-associated protein YjgA (DUF615 family)